MKRMIMVVALVATVTFLKAQDDTQLAKVDVLDGKQVFILNEPLQDYEIVGSVKTGVKFGSLLTRGILNENVNDKTTQFVRRTFKKLAKEEIEFDGILYKDGKFVNAIRFTEEANSENERLAEISYINETGIFIMAEPVQEYEVKSVVRNRLNIVPFLTYGIVNPSIEKDAKRFVKAANKKQEAQFISYSAGRKASIISFE